jgi:hypothetical protein
MTSAKFNLKRLCWQASVLVLLSVFSLVSHAADPVGKVLFAINDVQIERATGGSQTAAKGDALYEGDTVITGTQGRAQLQFVDGARTALRPGSELVIESYRPVTEEQNGELLVANGGSAVLGLLKGGMRAVSGKITKGNPDGMTVKTPVATMGIRGTDFTVVLTRGDGEAVVLNISVRDGVVRVSNELGEIDVTTGEFAQALQGILPQLLLEPPPALLDDTAGGATGSGQGGSAGGSAIGSSSSPSGSSSGSNTSGNSPGGSAGSGTGTEGGSDSSNNTGSSPTGMRHNAPVTNSDEPPGALPPPPPTSPPVPENPPQTTDGQNLEDPETEQEEPPQVFRLSMGADQDGGPDAADDVIVGGADNTSEELIRDSNGSLRQFTTQNASFLAQGANDVVTVSIIGVDVDTAQVRDRGADAVTGFEWGRWANGTAAVASAGGGAPEVVSLIGDQSIHWVYGLPVEGEPLAEVRGQAMYVAVGGTTPTDNAGNTGTLDTVFLVADFETADVFLDMQFTMNHPESIEQLTWNVSADGQMAAGGVMPFSGSLVNGGITTDFEGFPTPAGQVSAGGFSGSFSPNTVTFGPDATVPTGAGFGYSFSGFCDCSPDGNITVSGVAVVGNPESEGGL